MDHRPMQRAVIVVVLAFAVAALPGCKRAPEEAAPPTPAPQVDREQPPVEVLALPQHNPEIAISLSSVPPSLAITLNTDAWIELADLHNRSVRYSFIGISPEGAGPAAASTAEFERRVLESPNGRMVGRGTVETVFGPATWVCGVYDDDDGPVDDLHLFVPHPSGAGSMVLMSVCPPGAATTDDRLETMQELLTHVS